MEEKSEAVCGRMGQLLQTGRHEKPAGKHRRMDAATDPDGILEEMETGANPLPKPAQTWGFRAERGNIGQHEKRL